MTCNPILFPLGVPSFKFQVLIYLQHTLTLLLGWLANSEKLIAASQTVHITNNNNNNNSNNNNMLRGKLENKNVERKKLDLAYSSWNF